mgnify:CR=1 FL=1
MDYKKEILAGQYAYGMCGSSPCEDCNEFRHITNNDERSEFIKCLSEERCQEAKEYNSVYNKYKKEYQDKYDSERSKN